MGPFISRRRHAGITGGVHTLGPHHLDAIVDIGIECGTYPTTHREANSHFQIAEFTTGGYVATVGGRVVGYVLYAVLDRRRIELVQATVSPRHRLSGLGRLLVERLAVRARQSSHPMLVASVRDSAPDAFRFLEACGFGFLHVRHDFYGTNEDAYRMARDLSECTGK